MQRALTVLFTSLLLSGCAGSNFAKRWNGNRPVLVREVGEWERCCKGAKGYRWENEVFHSAVWPSANAVHRAEERVADIYAGMVRDVVATLWGMQEMGATFDVAITTSGRIQLKMLQPPRSGSEGAGPLIASVDQRISNHNAKQLVTEIERRLNMLPLHEDILETDELFDVKQDLYFTVRELAKIRREKEVNFIPPQGASIASYDALIRVSLVRLEADDFELQSFVAAMDATRLAIASIDEESGSSAANVAAVLDAVIAERDEARALREGALKDFPKEAEDVARYAEQGEAIFERVRTSADYKAWDGRKHTWDDAAQFGRQVVNAGKVMTTATAGSAGVDVGKIGDVASGTVELDTLLRAATAAAPRGSKLGNLLARAEQVEAVVGEAQTAAANPEGAAADGAKTATRVATRLVLLHSPEEVQAVQERLQQAHE
jgi:hypothetical protein